MGPFFNFALTANERLGRLAREGAEGERIRLEFQVFDGEGLPTPGDSMIEIWQADSHGSYEQSSEHFCGFGRLETDVSGRCVFTTVKPGRVAGPAGLQAPHINVTLFARGLHKHLHTRVYFAGEPANTDDFALSLVPRPGVRRCWHSRCQVRRTCGA